MREENQLFAEVLVATVVLSIVLLPNVIQAKTMASQTVFAPSNEWQESLLWIKENSPEPFHGADIYYDYQGQDNFGKYTKPDYSITAWWDYGYWITRIAHRVPSANPSQDPEPIKKVANLFLAQNEDYAKGIIEELGTKYIVLDYLTSSNKFYALAIWAGKAEEEFSEVYYVAYEGQLKPIRIFYVEYYQSMVVRLYNFDGKAVIRVRPTVITYVDKVDSEGEHYKLITYGEEFDSYKVALDFVNRNATPNIRIISTNPFISSVPLEALPDYRLVHNSGENIMSGVKVFEYTR